MPTKILYEAQVNETGGRDGRAAASDGSFDLKLTTPKALGGPGREGSNPEQLFAAGYAACFLNAMKFIALQSKQAFPADANITATVSLGPREDGGFGLAVALAVSLPGLDQEAAAALVSKPHATCPYSNAIRGNIDVNFTIN